MLRRRPVWGGMLLGDEDRSADPTGSSATRSCCAIAPSV
jgi:hypothetical protein